MGKYIRLTKQDKLKFDDNFVKSLITRMQIFICSIKAEKNKNFINTREWILKW